ncbi:MAG: TerB family tellurite resistance protein [Desulfobacterales bacterium]
MGWIGKLVGGTIGFAIGGPLGAIAGAAFGHAYDQSQLVELPQEVIRPRPGQEAQLTFFVAAFSMLAKLARADGRVTQREIDTINRFMLQDLNLDPYSRIVAMNIFQTAIDSPNTFEEFAGQFFGQFHAQPEILRLMIDILLRVSVADGELNPHEDRLILVAVRIFGFDEAVYSALRARYAPTADKYYAILGVKPDDSDEKIKSQYRKLVMKYHPDRIVSNGFPEEFTKFAQDKFREIQEAYEMIEKERKTR